MNISKGVARRKLLLEGLIVILIAISPILLYSYKYYPAELDIIKFLGFIKISTNGFADAQHALYWYLSKFIPLTYLIIWFVTSKQWWYHVILIPIAMYAFQFFNLLYNNEGKIDENEILYVIGVAMIITPIVYFIRLKLVDKYVHGIDLKAMGDELKLLKEKKVLREEIEKLKTQKEELEKKM